MTPCPRLEPGEQLKFFSPSELGSTIKKMNSKKVPRLNVISTGILKEVTRKALCKLAQIFNAIISLRYFPENRSWRKWQWLQSQANPVGPWIIQTYFTSVDQFKVFWKAASSGGISYRNTNSGFAACNNGASPGGTGGKKVLPGGLHRREAEKIKIMFHVFRVLPPGFSQNFSKSQS